MAIVRDENNMRYQTLSMAEKSAYSLISHALSSFADTIDITGIDKKVDVQRVIEAVLADNPQFFFFDPSQMTIVSSLSRRQLRLSGGVRKSQAMRMLNEIHAVARPLVEKAVKSASSAYEQLLSIYDSLQERITYDNEELNAVARGKPRRFNAHNAYGTLVEKNAVCDGFAAAFQFLTQQMGYGCTVISGKSDHPSYGSVAHSWNIIEIAGKYYHVDPTWDANHYADNGEHSYDWFLVDDEHILTDHTWDVNTTPVAADDSMLWHLRKRLLANSETEIVDIFTRAAQNSNQPVYLRCTERVWSSKAMDEYLSELLLNTALRFHSKAEISYSWDENTGCFFGKFVLVS